MLKTYDLGVFLSEALKFWGRLVNFDRETHQRMAQRLQALCFDVLAFRCSCFFVCSCIPSAKPGLRVYCTETARHLNAQGANLGAQSANLSAQGADLGAHDCIIGRLYKFYKLYQILCFPLKIGSSSADSRLGFHAQNLGFGSFFKRSFAFLGTTCKSSTPPENFHDGI